MLTLYDYLPSQNAWKVRQVLRHLSIPHRTELVSIFEGEGQSPSFLAINPWGAVPAIRLEDGGVLSESNAILFFLARGTHLLPTDAYRQAKVVQWLSFEADYVQTSAGSLRYWTLTAKLEAKPSDVVAAKRATAARALRILDKELATRPFIAGDDYTIADISMFAYAHCAPEGGVPTAGLSHFQAWLERVRARPGFLSEMFPYSIDPHAVAELP